LHDINDVMHSHKYKTQTSHEHVHKLKHFYYQLFLGQHPTYDKYKC
jgi:hypothetical protein